VKLCKQFLKKNIDDELICTKFTIFNNTSSAIGISQRDTNEMICVMPQAKEFYQFYTDKRKQVLQLSIYSNGTWSGKTEAFSIHHESIEYLKVDDFQYFIVTVKNISNYQRKVIIDGQVSIFNMTKEFFRVQYKRYDKDIDTPEKCEIQESNVNSQGNFSVFGNCQFDSQQSIRLRLIKSDKKLFSGEIPVRLIN
jgi:hypothetical protein